MQSKVGKAVAAVLALVVIVGGVFVFRSVSQNNDLPAEEEYLAGGTIPASAKRYPIIYEDLPMAVQTDEGVITEEDIYYLTKYVDMRLAFYSTLTPDKLPEEDECVFFDVEGDYQDTFYHHNNDGWYYEVTGTQILTIMPTEKVDEIYVLMAVAMTGHGCDYYDEYTEDSDRILLIGNTWKKISGNWHLISDDSVGGDWQIDSVRVVRDYPTGLIDVQFV